MMAVSMESCALWKGSLTGTCLKAPKECHKGVKIKGLSPDKR